MNYSEIWRILEGITTEFRQRGLTVSPEIVNDLRMARALIKIYESGSDKGEVGSKVEELLGKIEAYLITEAQKSFEPAYVDKWLKLLEEASYDLCEFANETQTETRFIPGVPRDQKWIRIKLGGSLNAQRICQLAEETELAARVDGDEYVLVYGKETAVRTLIKKLSQENR
jgi:hypothetical protein